MTKKILFILITSFIITSCFQSKYPLGNIENASIDDNLIGLWKFKDKNSKGYFLVQKGIKNYYHIYTQDNPFVFNNSTLSNFQGYITKISNQYFFNLQALQIMDGKQADNNKAEFIIMHYVIEKNKISLKFFDINKLKNSIKRNELKGEVTKYNIAKIESNTQDLNQFILKYKDKALSRRSITLKKINFK